MLDTGLARPPSPTYTAITPATRAPDENKPSAETDLPVEETVTPATESDDSQRAANNEREQRSLLERFTPTVERQNVIDPDSESLIYVATNTETGQVVRQVPAETLLRLRAYAETLSNQQSEQQARQADTSVQRIV